MRVGILNSEVWVALSERFTRRLAVYVVIRSPVLREVGRLVDNSSPLLLGL